ncbi:bifunctional DNA-formamidopyrimidine glycosylase/DNA-(apurinic or apyrimidinic site) lyase [Planomonospora parontospora]|uniref:bifunctional DNA-formamidopyrimidine glycosylase/DNA-(apurinic or apyrimidinic site) lyase n=1 Tax=Planomonospora parontospora TaxID=58119 RepID=UPI001671526B|nr:bifunctional DNA-formamidopyrimidine glycosylase/DNA-(apurinic or apyrimidinic site) lyase [Planomonospora parontospora]GGL39451.1 formamidopyrimidine-DNA glycosylase [Planomonospora parontospora subsp. antibiotica]GII18142.1 formamidopyrimidine-DNA glycosylase [Planomonospora parontospora subsp. antibiotica]
MPELPEVEVVRRGLERWVAGRTVARAEVLHPRAVRRHVPGAEEFAARLAGRTIGSAERRGKYLWLPLDGSDAILAHLGMSGQLLVVEPDAAPERHLRIRLGFADGGPELRFVDQRTFGHVLVAPMTLRLPRWVPEPIAHIAADPFEDEFDDELFTIGLRRRRTEVKRALLDQSLISGVGNIYADEALWRARLHGTRPADTLTRPKIAELLAAAREVMSEALAEGGTSFDSLYVNVNGESGYFERSLAVYGRRGLPCRRCGAPVVRESFMNRSSYSCPRCQPPPRRSRKMGA